MLVIASTPAVIEEEDGLELCAGLPGSINNAWSPFQGDRDDVGEGPRTPRTTPGCGGKPKWFAFIAQRS